MVNFIKRPTQKERLRELFERRPNEWISLPDILYMGIAQYGARILELRREGMNIENRVQEINGERHSWFIYKTVIMERSGQAVFATCV